MNRVTICREKCLHIMNLATSCYCYNSEEKSIKFPNPKMKLNKIDASFPAQVLYPENDRFLKIFSSIYLEKFTHLF